MARKLKVNRPLIVVIFLLLGVGLLTVASSGALLKGSDRNIFFAKQCAVTLLGLTLLFMAMRVPYRSYLKPLPVKVMIGLTILILAGLYILPAYKGTHRWIVFPGFTLQPSEFVKIVLLFYLSSVLPKIDWNGRWQTLLIFPAAAIFLILMEPDLGSAFICMAVTGVLFFVAGLPRRYIVLSVTLALLFVAAAIFSTGYRHARLTAFLNAEAHAETEAYQSIQATKAIGSGRLMGKGVGGSTQKLFYLPQPHTDFAFAIVGEELGFLGAIFVIVLYLLLMWHGHRTAMTHPHEKGRFLAFGIAFLIFLQAVIHLSVNLSLMPTKGLALPFISYGGSSLLATCILAGILLKISEEKV